MHLSTEQLEAGLDHIKASPAHEGAVEHIVCRPANNERQPLTEAVLDVDQGLVGDNWQARHHEDKSGKPANKDRQLTLMNARAVALIAGERDRWQLAGDQFYVDLDLSDDNLPPGTRLALGSAVVEVTAEPHLGCAKFIERFGRDAVMFVNSPAGRALNLRGVNARIVTGGTVKVGDRVTRLAGETGNA